MDTALGDQAQLIPDPGVGHQFEHVEVNQEDDFDFEIGGDDGFDLTGEAENEDDDLIDRSGTAHDHVDQHDMYQSQEQEPQALVAQNDDNEDHDSYQEIDASSLVPDNFAATAEFTQDTQTGFQVANQEVTDQNTETFSQEGNYYDETAGEFEDLDDGLQPEPVQDHDPKSNATSVDGVHAEDDLQEPASIADDDETEPGDHVVQEFEVVAGTVQNVEISEDIEPKDATQIRTATPQTENADARNDTAGTNLAKDDTEGELVVQTSDQSEWNEEEDDHDDSHASPIVTVSYRGQEYSMFVQAAEDDPNTYFLDNINSLYQPLSEFLGSLRQVISSEIEAGHELFVRIDGLGLEFGESTEKDFVDQTTLAQIIEVNDKLSQNDGGSQHAELYIFLSARSNPVQRFAELAKGAEEGHGLSYFEQYYEESPAGVSLLDDEEKYDVPQDVGSDHLSPEEEPSGDSEQVDEGIGKLPNAEHGHNPFRVDDRQLPLNDAAITEMIGAEAEAGLVENEADGTTDEAGIAVEDVNGVSSVDQGDDANLDLTSTELQAMTEDYSYGDDIPVLEQVETEMGEDWEHNEDVEAQFELSTTEAENSAEQTELLINNSGEGHEHSDDMTATVPNDEDYLDLGHDADNQLATTGANATELFGVEPRITPNSSATATLNGEENSLGSEAVATQELVDLGDETSNQKQQNEQNEDDEIDWNNEDDNDIGVADQSPTELSPSSLSAKRSRQEGESIDGLGEDSAAKRRRT